MTPGYGYMIAALLCFAGMGVTHKMGDRLKCNPLNIALVTMVSACVLTLIRATVGAPGWFVNIPYRAALLAVPFGVSAAVALWLFQKGLRHGHIVTSWLLINLSTAIPTVLSIALYHEPLSMRKTLTLVLIVASLLLLWWDRKSSQRTEITTPAATVTGGE
jgi:drug/metabolite transporter (DMT)-like permease